MDGVAELGPGAALDGAFAETRVGELARARGGGDLHLVPVLVELVLDHLLYPVLVGPYHLPRRQEEVQILSVVLLERPKPLGSLSLSLFYSFFSFNLGFSVIARICFIIGF